MYIETIYSHVFGDICIIVVRYNKYTDTYIQKYKCNVLNIEMKCMKYFIFDVQI